MSRPLILTRTGSTAVSTAQSQFGGASARFFGDGLLTVAPGNYLNFGTGAFTVEFWLRVPSLPGSGNTFRLIDQEYTGIVSWYLQLNSNGSLQMFGGTGGSPSSILGTDTGIVAANTWYHVAVTRSGTDLRIFVNGTQRGSNTNSSNFQVNGSDTYNMVFGGARFGAAYLTGWLDEIRISNTARYTTGFTAPSQAFENDNNTRLLIHADGADASTTFTDDTVKQFAANLPTQATITAAISGSQSTQAALTITVTVTALAESDAPRSRDTVYFDDGYIDSGYFVYTASMISDVVVESSVSATVEAIVPRSRDTVYFDDGYIDSGYFVYTASAVSDVAAESSLAGAAEIISGEVKEFESQLSAVFTNDTAAARTRDLNSSVTAEFTKLVTVSRTRDSSINVTAEFAQTATISHIEGADLFAFSEAQLQLDVDRIRGNNIDATAVFDISVDYVRIIQSDAVVSSEFTQTSSVERSRDIVSNNQAAFSFDAITGYVIDAEIITESLFDTDLTVNAILRPTVFLETNTETAATAVKITDVDATMLSVAASDITAQRTRSTAADLDTDSAVTAASDRTRSTDLAAAAEFTAAIDAESFTDFEITLSAEFTQLTAISRTRPSAADFISDTAVSTATDRRRNTTATVSADTEFVVTVIRIQPATAAFTVAFDTDIQAQVRTGNDVNIVCTAAVTALANYTVVASSAFDSIAVKIAAAVKNTNNEVIINSTATVTGTATRIIDFAPRRVRPIRSALENSAYAQIPQTPENSTLVNKNEFGPGQPGALISIWYRRRSIPTGFDSFTNFFEPIWSGDNFGIAFTLGITGRAGQGNAQTRNDILLRWNFDADEGLPTWYDAAPLDLNWHHVLLYAIHPTFQDTTTAVQWQLWVDGEAKGFGSEEHSAFKPRRGWTGRSGPGQDITGNPTTPVLLGRGTVAAIAQPHPTAAQTMDGEFLQFWAGNWPQRRSSSQYTGSDRVPVQEFYNNGFVDLGLNGRGSFNQLPTPVIYNPMLTTANVEFVNYTDVSSQQGTAVILPYQAQTRLTATAVGVTTFAVNPQVSTVLSAQAQISVSAQTDMHSMSTMSVTATSSAGLTADIDSVTVFALQADRTRSTPAVIDTTAQITVTVGLRQQADINISSAFATAIEITVIDPIRAQAFLQSNTALTVTVSVIKVTAADLVAAATITAAITVIPPVRATADLTAEFALDVQATTAIDITAQITTVSSLSLDITKFTGILENLTTEFTVTEDVTKFTGIVADLEVQAFKLTAGDVVNLDPALTITITGETRNLVILKETRELQIKPETRLNTILKG
jgi:hypothetical protein